MRSRQEKIVSEPFVNELEKVSWDAATSVIPLFVAAGLSEDQWGRAWLLVKHDPVPSNFVEYAYLVKRLRMLNNEK